jgi:hypothetical protein
MNVDQAMTLPRITRRAVEQIKRLWETLESDKRRAYIPSVSLAFNTRSDELPFIPCIGGHLRASVPAECLVEAHGLKVAFSLTDEAVSRYQEYVLDFIENEFVFLDKSAAKFLDKDR